MIIPACFQGKTVAVLGLGRSGLSAVQALMKAGARVLPWDDQEKTREMALSHGIPLVNLDDDNWDSIDFLVISPGIPHQHPRPHPLAKRAHENGIPCISDIEILCLSQPKARFVAITGTNGKSTTTALIGHILKTLGIPTQVGGNIGVPALSLDPLNEDGVYVLELSSYQLETTPHLTPTVAVLLNISPDHLDRHGGMDGYKEAKRLIFKNASKGIIGIDDPYCAGLYDSQTMIPVSVTQGLSEGICVKEGFLYENGRKVADLKGIDRLKGRHNWQNMAAAYGALRALGIESEPILEAIKSFPGLAHRQQQVARHGHVLFINDSKATNAEAVEKAFQAYPDVPIYWLLGGQSKEGGIQSLEPCFPQVNHAFLFGQAVPEFELSLKGKVDYTICEALEEATHKAAKLAFSRSEQECIVLLSPACASWDQFRDFEERGEAFCRAVHEFLQPID